MSKNISRRDFIKLGTLALGSLAFRPLSDWLPEGEGFDRDPIGVGRVTVDEIEVYREPSYQSDPVSTRRRDQLIPIFEEIVTPDTLPNSPRWYQVMDGYAHSAHIQRVEGRHINATVPWVPEEGRLGEITVPYTRAYLNNVLYGWMPVYRLYYQSVHWITGVDEGPDGRADWYQISDESDDNLKYFVPAPHVRLIPPDELSPISPEVAWEDKRIEVSRKEQTLTAYERDQVVLHTLVSTGIPSWGVTANGIPTATPAGKFNIQVKMPSKHMGDGRVTDDIQAYELPGVPWVCFFDATGAAFHGTYWHYNFGRQMSHGCVNMTVEDAKWLYRWTLPKAEFFEWERRGYGTRVHIV